jgi:Fe-S-cluster formation regulator IscX/YfhJ
MNWKKSHSNNIEIYDSFGSLGTRYWQNFCRHNAAVISAKKAVRFDSKRDEWCHLDNFEDMYDDVYETLCEAGIAEKLDEAAWRDKDNNIVGTQAEAYGRNTQYSLLNPEYLVMVDEVGEHISQKGDGNAGGQKFMVANNMRAQVRNSFKDNHFTVLGFAAANGQPTMFAIVIAATKLKVTDVTG